jgi:AraC family transcriptional regulator
MHVELRLLPPMHLAFMRCTGPYGDPAVTRTWNRFTTWCRAHGLDTPQRTRLGILQDRPTLTPANQCRYDCCVEVDENFAPSGDVQVQSFAGGRYACGQFKGTATELHAAWMALGNEWLPTVTADGAWRLADTPLLELYPGNGRLNAETETIECWLCLPICAA